VKVPKAKARITTIKISVSSVIEYDGFIKDDIEMKAFHTPTAARSNKNLNQVLGKG
jgi:hypothetical protein